MSSWLATCCHPLHVGDADGRVGIGMGMGIHAGIVLEEVVDVVSIASMHTMIDDSGYDHCPDELLGGSNESVVDGPYMLW